MDNVNPSNTSSSTGITIENTPVIYVYFPPEYKIAWYNSKPGACIDEYTSNADNVISKTGKIVSGNVVQSGNRIAITLTQASVTFGTNWRYWDISINNIVNPPDTTNITGPPANKTTHPYYITLTNNFSELDGFSGKLVCPPASNICNKSYNCKFGCTNRYK